MAQNVSFFIPSLEGGGAEKCTLTLAKSIRKRGIGVDLVLSSAKGPHLAEAREDLNVVDLGADSNLWSISELVHYMKETKPQLLISAMETANVAALMAKRLSGVGTRLCITTHTMVSIAVRTSPRVTSRGLVPVMRLLYPSADLHVAVCEAVATDLASLTGLSRDSIKVIPNPVDVAEIRNLSNNPVQAFPLGRATVPIVIGVGSLSPHKDHKTLIEATSIVRRTKPVRLLILGEGTERRRLHGLSTRLGIEQDVIMPGFVENPYAWISKSAVFVLPSRWEGLPTVLIEAMACGVTPVATDCPGGTSEILEHGRYGRLTPVGDAKAMAEAILQALEKPMRPQELVERAKAFSVENAVNKYMEIIEVVRP